MKKRIVSLLSVIMILVMMCPTDALAAGVAISKLPASASGAASVAIAKTTAKRAANYIFSAYPKGNVKIQVYKTPNLKDPDPGHYVGPNDECRILQIKPAWLEVEYPVPGGYRTGWVESKHFTQGDLSKPLPNITFNAKAATYMKPDGKVSYGSIAKGDKIFFISVEGRYIQVIYPIKGRRKMAWVKTADINKTFKLLPHCDITVKNMTYTSKALKPAVTVKLTFNASCGFAPATLKNDTDYALKYANNVNAGTGKVTVTGKGSYAGSSVTKTFTIARRNIKDCTITIKQPLYYTGKAQKPTIVVKYGNYVLVEGKDYTVSKWSNNKNAGTGKVTITGKGNFTGSVTKTFKISLRPIAYAAITLGRATILKWKSPVKAAYNGVTLKEGTDYTLAYKRLSTTKGQVTITGKGNFNGKVVKTYTIYLI